jgi:hypothetical protein
MLARMLGVRRPTVTEQMRVFESRGMLRNKRGLIEVENRKRLEAVACDCFRIIQSEYDRILGPTSDAGGDLTKISLR